MAEYNYRIVKLFAEERLAGNPLAVFEDARGMAGVTMQAIASAVPAACVSGWTKRGQSSSPTGSSN